MKKNFNRNPEGHNQWILRSNEEIQKIIDKHPTWTKKDFRRHGQGEYISYSGKTFKGEWIEGKSVR